MVKLFTTFFPRAKLSSSIRSFALDTVWRVPKHYHIPHTHRASGQKEHFPLLWSEEVENILWTFQHLYHWSLNYLVLRTITKLIKWLATFFTLVAFLSSMNYQVFQKFLVQKTVLFSQMNPLMLFKTGSLVEDFATFSTLVPFLSGMNSLVFGACCVRSGVFATFFTLVGFLPSVS